jgi:hypothetical protein
MACETTDIPGSEQPMKRKHELTESDRWHLDFAKIERRFDRDDLDDDQRDQLWDLRNQLFDVGEVPDLDCRLREIAPPRRRGVP